MANCKFHVIAPADDHHLLGCADAFGHWLFAENCLRFVGRGRDRPGSMALVPCANRHDIWPLFFHHPAAVCVMCGGNVELLVLFGHRLCTQVGQCYDFIAPRGQVTLDVIPGNPADAYYCGT